MANTYTNTIHFVFAVKFRDGSIFSMENTLYKYITELFTNNHKLL
jgi:hypothetical protein